MIPTGTVEKPVENEVTNWPDPRQCLLPDMVTIAQAVDGAQPAWRTRHPAW
jgi:hypothetical protein